MTALSYHDQTYVSNEETAEAPYNTYNSDYKILIEENIVERKNRGEKVICCTLNAIKMNFENRKWKSKISYHGKRRHPSEVKWKSEQNKNLKNGQSPVYCVNKQTELKRFEKWQVIYLRTKQLTTIELIKGHVVT